MSSSTTALTAAVALAATAASVEGLAELIAATGATTTPMAWGIGSVIDLAVIVLFTHPMMVWILRFAFFGEGHRLSGLDPEHLGARSLAAYGKGRQAAIDSVVGTLARRKAEARRKADGRDGSARRAVDDRADARDGDGADDAVAFDSAIGKDGETK